MKWCKCMRPLRPREATGYLWAEVAEFIQSPSRDELSDCIFAVGRLLGGLVGLSWIPLPGMGRDIRKMEARMKARGCVRSKNHPHCGG